jgi:hypothetical protein
VALYFAILGLAGRERFDRTPETGSSGAGPAVAGCIGGKACASCHADEYQRWTGSHHDLATQLAGETTVLADFGGAQFTYNGITSEFLQRNGPYFFRTYGADVELAGFEVTHTSAGRQAGRRWLWTC